MDDNVYISMAHAYSEFKTKAIAVEAVETHFSEVEHNVLCHMWEAIDSYVDQFVN